MDRGDRIQRIETREHPEDRYEGGSSLLDMGVKIKAMLVLVE